VRAHECFHCKQLVPAGVAHDCWTTTEHALTKDLSEELRDAYERIRETAVEFGDQRIYASHHSIMFSRKACYFFVRPNPRRLEVVFFTRRPIKSPEIRKVVRTSKTKLAHLIHVIHRDQVEQPLTGWLREAYAFEDTPKRSSATRPAAKRRSRRSRIRTRCRSRSSR
jgi:hypothetical protein